MNMKHYKSFLRVGPIALVAVLGLRYAINGFPDYQSGGDGGGATANGEAPASDETGGTPSNAGESPAAKAVEAVEGN